MPTSSTIEELQRENEQLREQLARLSRPEHETQRLLAAVNEERDRLSALVNSISDEVWFADTQKRFTLANPSALMEFRLESGGIDIETLAASLEVYRPDGSPRPVEETPPLRALAGEVVRNQEERVRTPASGELRHRLVSSAPVRDAAGAVIGAVSVVRDITELRRAEEALRQQRRELEIKNQQLQALFNYSAASLVLFDARRPYTVLAHNKYYQELWHEPFRTQGMVGKTILDYVPDAGDVLALYDEVVQTRRGKTLLSFSYDGMPRGRTWWNWHLSPVMQGDEVVALAHLAVDVTAEVTARDALRETRDYLESLFGHANAPIIVWDPALRITRFNRAFERLTSYQAQEVIGRELQLLFPEESRETSLAKIMRTAEGEHWESVEIPIRRKDGEVRLALWNSANVRDKEGERIVATVAQGQDITQRKQAEEALRASEERLRLALTAGRMATWDWHVPSGEVIWNEEHFRVLGYEPGSVVPSYRAWAERIHPEDRAATERLVQASVKRGGEYGNEFRSLALDGTVRWLEARGCIEHDAAGQPLRQYGVMLDITERKRAEEEREQYLAAVEEANEAKDLFFNTLSHELRTPLAAMLNAVEVLKNPDAAQAQRARVTNLLERNIRHQTRLIDDLLDLSRIMRKKVELVHQTLDLRQLVAAQVEGVEVGARRARLALETTAPTTPVVVSADPVRLGQVISNLLTNAIKYTEPGGTITVRVAVDGDRAAMRVKDTGIGIAPELLPHIFEVFRQAETSLARSKGGLGIGLAVARSLAELHGGTLEGASEGLGRGSEFTLQLPLCADDAAAHRAGSAAAAATKRRVLVVEDSVDLLESMIILLELMGHSVVAAKDGSAAIEVARRERPDAALIDIGLPDMDGYEVARRLRADPATRDTRLVALTGYATPEHRARALAAGFDHHLAKPVGMDELQQALQS